MTVVPTGAGLRPTLVTEEFDKTFLMDDWAYYVPQMRHFEGQGTVVPTSAGLRPTRIAEELNLPYFAKATKGF